MRGVGRLRRLIAGCAALAAVAAAGCGGTGAPRSDGSSAPPTDARSLTATLRSLHVTSERYTQTTRIRVEGPHARVQRFVDGLRGEVDARAGRGATFATGPGHLPLDVVVGTSRWFYFPAIASCDGGRPWVLDDTFIAGQLTAGREHGVGPQLGRTAAYPYAALPGEPSRGGTGPYAGLVNLLATVRGPVRDLGPATVRGKPVTEFAALVDPALVLPRGSRLEEPPLQQRNEAILIAQTEMHSAPTKLRLYIAADGLPLRVVTDASFDHGTYQDEEQTDVLAVNVPVSVEPPPTTSTATKHDMVFRYSKCPSLLSRHAIGG